ncbi:3-dehydroquinate synthase [Sediminicurvatus halobius]|uniref:3-dehydroquinate synthase n=1 Tax=Sediminicurvatus halobius TaxID=2182432 RepID=A0A2U2N797_9GAMM|nr:3-dehydroquinate synthase [Spiribacter halobius]PWG64819.1 3-dehydroquinate synthase [Spiribacter halobius]UEX78328.1 3-dehydroquinate synthase [Spiribacter halobius]
MPANPERRQVRVELPGRAYPIEIGRGLLDDGATVAGAVPGRQVLLVSNETVAPHYLARLEAALEGRLTASVVLPDGEAHKRLETTMAVYDQLIDAGFDRGCTVVALGGGVIGDLAGFAAATYQRGVAFVQVPTTLLAMVDSSVGGKTGVNHPRGKNMIGAFHQPRAVIADLAVLDTLPDRELRAGLAEVIKYGLLGDPEFLAWLEADIERLLAREPDALAYAVERSCRNKAAIVVEDEREAGRRALLNLGHTFGHAIEAATGYGPWLHGEAIAAGQCMAAWMSAELGWITPADYERVAALFARAGLPTRPPGIGGAAFRRHMAVDKKARDGQLRLVLLRRPGEAVVTGDYPATALTATLAHFEAHHA